MSQSAGHTEPSRIQAVEALFAPLEVRAYTAIASEHLVRDLHPEERAAIEPMVANRQAEFATARACARAALGDLGIAAAIPKQASGAPLWPAGATGSISHTKGFCLAVASVGDNAVGLDAELVHRMKPAIERRILVDKERADLDGIDGAARRTAVATIFAAKEAFYKAHYEIDARYIGFDAVSVSILDQKLTFSPGSGAVESQVLARATGRFSVDQGRAIAGVTIGSVPIPSPA